MSRILLDELKGGFGLALRRWPMMLTLAGLIALSTAVLSFALVDVLSQVAVLRGGQQLRKHHAVFFTPYYPWNGVSQVRGDTVHYLMEVIDQRQAYSAIVYNMALDNPDFAGGYPTLVLFGEVVPDLFPDVHLCAPAPCAERGAQVVGEVVDAVDIGGDRIPVEKTLPRGATFFDVNVAGLPLDHRIVVRAPTKIIPQLAPIEREELLTRAVFLNPPDSTVYRFVAGAARGDLFLVPHRVSVEQPRRFREIMMRSVMYIVGMLAFLALAFMTFMSSARLVMQQERRSFKIRQMYGATPLHISLRIGGFLAAVVLFPQIVLLVLLQIFLLLVGAPAPNAPAWVMVCLFIVFGVLWFSLVREVLAKEGLGGW
jgi:hypothetical protein